jgi:hypothetical protein
VISVRENIIFMELKKPKMNGKNIKEVVKVFLGIKILDLNQETQVNGKIN